jgi:hypothetical protein
MKPIDFNLLTKYHNYICGVYLIQNKITGKRYFGSSWCVRTRILSHKTALKNNNHVMAEIQRDYNALGEDAFKFYVIKIKGEIDRPSARSSEANFIKHQQNFYFTFYVQYTYFMRMFAET